MIDLDKLERLHREATPGPWSTEYTKLGDGFYGQLIFDSKGETIAQLAWHKKIKKPGIIGTDRDENARYIVDACNSLPGLIARVRELERNLSHVTFRYDEMEKLYCEYHDVNLELKKYLAKLEAEPHANQTWLTWQKGYPTEPGLYRLKYEDGTVRVDTLCFRIMNQSRRYLGFANEFAHPIEDDEDLIAWAGPIPEPAE